MNKDWLLKLWLWIGLKAGFVSRPYCATHEGNYEYITYGEREDWDDDPCHLAVSILIGNPYQGMI